MFITAGLLLWSRFLFAEVVPVQAVNNTLNTCVVFSNRQIKCWGHNEHGQLGLGDIRNRGGRPNQMGKFLPYIDLGKDEKVRSLAIGWEHICALLDDQSVKCWGMNNYGQLGLGDKMNRGDGFGQMGDTLPKVDLGKNAKAIAITAGHFHSCALLNDFSVKCWGYNFNGQLGVGDNINRGDKPGQMGDALPRVDLGKNAKVLQLSTGTAHNCVLLEGHKIKCWGYNEYGELGMGHTQFWGDSPDELGDYMPSVDLGTPLIPTVITSGYQHNCVTFENGRVKCWGYNLFGTLGLGDAINRGDLPDQMGENLPFVDFGKESPLVKLAVGETHNCVLLENKTVKCWGNNQFGVLGQGDTLIRGNQPNQMGENLPAVPLNFPVEWISRGSSATHHCAYLKNYGLKCWGANFVGQLGLEDLVDRGIVPNDMGNNLGFVDLGLGRFSFFKMLNISLSSP